MKGEMQILLAVLLVCAGGLEVVELAATTSNHTIMKGEVIMKPGCESTCGDLTVPFPFGIGPECSIKSSFNISCDNTTNPPKASMFIGDSEYEVTNISDTELRTSSFVSHRCYDSDIQYVGVFLNLSETPYTFSKVNVLTVVGCDEIGYIYDNKDFKFPKGCVTSCSNAREVPKHDCSGTGCCQVQIKARKYVETYVGPFNNNTDVFPFNPCGYAFFGEKIKFKFRGASDLTDRTFKSRTEASVPLVLDWVIDENKTCEEAAQDSKSYACISNNSLCVNTSNSGGYRCSCKQGYGGNPYLNNSGCNDINECEDPSKNDCGRNICTNTIGSYTCSCKHGYYGDGRTCIADKKHNRLSMLLLAISSGFGAVLLLIAIWWLHTAMERSNIQKLKERFFEKNGGLLLQQQLSSPEGEFETNKLFTSIELEKATDGYNEDRILGQGGQGTVYKGMMRDGRIVAIKKSKIEDETKLNQFINEVVILSQTNHRNIVKLHGCCLETEVPLLVYEFIPNGTLFHYIHDHNEDFQLSWNVRVRIAAEVAGALFYLHSAASIPIYHRDVKSTNILLDHKYSAKVADFGTSKSIAVDQTHMTTRVQGTFGYLDPEYFQSSQYTDKSDVYSFGVVLVELLTGQKPILLPSSNYEGRSLATLFMLAIKEDRLFDIVDSRVIKEDAREEIWAFANLANRCLNLNGRKRPTMREVSAELDRIRKIGTPDVEQQYDEVDNVQAESSGPWDYTSTSLSSSSIMNSLSIDVEPLIFSK